MIKDVIKVERKRVLSKKLLLIIISLITVFSIFEVMEQYKSYRIYDNFGNVEIEAKENLEKSKKKKIILDKEGLIKIINREDTSKYFYNTNLTRIILENFKGKKFNEITEDNLKRFYNVRIENIIEKEKPKDYSAKELEVIKERAKDLKAPLEIGYVEGWKNLNNHFGDFVLKLIIGMSIILTSVFSKDQKTNMDGLSRSTKEGRKTLVKARFIVALKISIIIYLIGVLIYSIVYFSVFGIEGWDLVIQNSVGYFNCIYNITYLDQFILNNIIGVLAVILTTSIVLLITNLVEQTLTSGITITFFWIFIMMIPKGLVGVQHIILNFLPYNMTDLNGIYLNNEIYKIGEEYLLRGELTVIITSFCILLITGVTYIKAIKKTSL